MKSSAIPAEVAGGGQKRNFTLDVGGVLRHLELVPAKVGDVWQVLLDGVHVEVNARLLEPGVLSLILDGRVYRCALDEGPIETAVAIEGARWVVSQDDPRSLAARRRGRSVAGGEQTIRAPMPGRIVRVLVQQGEEVEACQAVVAIEAMKMQNELKAARSGKIREIRVEPGQTVTAGEILLVIE